METVLTVPAPREEFRELRAGDYVYLTGTIYTARDAAHKRLYESLTQGEALPIDLEGTVIYYLGPTPPREGQAIGSAGPTTSSRMDKYTPLLLRKGMVGMIGKGKRSEEVRKAIVEQGAVYFAAVGGAGALLSKCIRSVGHDIFCADGHASAVYDLHERSAGIQIQKTVLGGKHSFCS